MDENLQELRRLSKDCNLRSVSKAEHRDGFIWDVFINGILSHPIRQRRRRLSKNPLVRHCKKTTNHTFVQALARQGQQSHKMK